MPRGTPDYGQYAPATTITRMADLGELAARLGSIVTFDRRGEVVWLDDFEGGLNKWTAATTGTGASVDITAETARSGMVCAKLVTGDATNNNARITRYSAFPVLSKMGFEFSFSIPDASYLLMVTFVIYDGSTFYDAEIRYRDTTEELEVLAVPFDVYTFATGVKLHRVSGLFHTCKLVIDPVNKKYVRFILNNTSYDLSSYDIYSPASTIFPHVYVRVWFQTLTDASRTIFVDNAIVTQNES